MPGGRGARLALRAGALGAEPKHLHGFDLYARESEGYPALVWGRGLGLPLTCAARLAESSAFDS